MFLRSILDAEAHLGNVQITHAHSEPPGHDLFPRRHHPPVAQGRVTYSVYANTNKPLYHAHPCRVLI